MAGMPIVATWDQDSFQWYTDAGGEGTNPIGAANSNPSTLAIGTQYRLRYLIQETAGSNSAETPVFEMEYRVDPAGGTTFGSWLPIDSDDTYFTAVSTANVTDNGTTTQQLGAGTFNDGEFSYVDAAARAPTNAMAATAGNDEYECEWVLNLAAAADGANFEFRVTRDTGTVMDTTTNTTQVLIPSTTDALTAVSVESTSETTAPAVGQTHVLTATSVQSLSQTDTPIVGQGHVLTAVSVESPSELTVPALAEVTPLLAVSVESTSEASVPALAQVHVLTAVGNDSLSEASVPAIAQVHELTAVSAESVSETSAPTLAEVGGADALLADDVDSLTETEIATLSQVHILNLTSLDSLSQVSSPALDGAGAVDAEGDFLWGMTDPVSGGTLPMSGNNM
jgi:hypothetical protein